MTQEELKPNELMIGDWVLINPWDNRKPFHPCKVVAISYNSWRGKDYTDWIDCDYWDEISPSDIGPIPLTEEILKKNGFQYFHKNFCSLSYDHPFKLEMKQWPDENGLGGLWTVCGIIEIRFVHQLQHALRICGIKKEIVIKKK